MLEANVNSFIFYLFYVLSKALKADTASDGATVNTDFSVRSKGRGQKKAPTETKMRAPSVSAIANKSYVDAQVIKSKRDLSPAKKRDLSPAKGSSRDSTPSKRIGSSDGHGKVVGPGSIVNRTHSRSSSTQKTVAFASETTGTSAERKDSKAPSSASSSRGGRPPHSAVSGPTSARTSSSNHK